MARVEWSDELSVGIPQVDEEHRKLVDVFNQLDEAMQSGKGTRVMGEILGKLVEYTGSHFEAEEKLMAAAEYPNLTDHQRQHRQLMAKVGRFKIRFTVNGQRITKEMMDFLETLLTRHILVDDKAFGEYHAGVPQ